MQANHLRFVAPLVIELSWRGYGLIHRLLRGETVRRWVSHPYRQVREEVGSVVAIAMDACTPFPSHCDIGRQACAAIRADVDDFVAHMVGACHVPPDLGMPSAAATANAPPAEGAAPVEVLLEPEGEAERDAARAARETTLRVVTHCAMQARSFAIVEHVPALLPPIVCAAASMQRPDLANTAKTCSVLMAHFPFQPKLFGGTLAVLRQLATGGSWRMRGGLLPFLGVVAYRGQFIEPTEEHAAAVRSALRGLLADPQHEVREATASVLAGFIRLRGPAERSATLAWARSLTRKKKSAPLTERHAGVLALVALLQLAPYDVPAWLPDVIELLSSFYAEPQPIKATVSKAFADFKRTHQDNWASHRERFTPEQQDLISDMLVSPSFYA